MTGWRVGEHIDDRAKCFGVGTAGWAGRDMLGDPDRLIGVESAEYEGG
jgi:hypothetical protein